MGEATNKQFVKQFYATPDGFSDKRFCSPEVQSVWECWERYTAARAGLQKAGFAKTDLAAATERMQQAFEQFVFRLEQLDKMLCPEQSNKVSEALRRIATQKRSDGC